MMTLEHGSATFTNQRANFTRLFIEQLTEILKLQCEFYNSKAALHEPP